jgi:hypothetical protein
VTGVYTHKILGRHCECLKYYYVSTHFHPNMCSQSHTTDEETESQKESENPMFLHLLYKIFS